MDSLLHLPPGMIIIIGALFLPVFPKKMQGWGALLLPLISFAHLMIFQDGYTMNMDFMNMSLEPILDPQSRSTPR